MNPSLLALGAEVVARLRHRGEKLVVAETSAGGLVSAALLAVPGASHVFVGGVIPYSFDSIRALGGIDMKALRGQGIRSSSEPYAALLAKTVRDKHPGIHWCVSETGAAGNSSMTRSAGKIASASVPSRSLDFSLNVPSCIAIRACTIGRPRPVPSWLRVAVDPACPNGVSAISSSSGLMPMPSSSTSIITAPSSRLSRGMIPFRSP